MRFLHQPVFFRIDRGKNTELLEKQIELMKKMYFCILKSDKICKV